VWKSVGAKATGTSHAASGTECQDAFKLGSVAFAGEHIFFAAVADGAGSAALSHIGSRIAVRTAAMFMRRAVQFGRLPSADQMLDAAEAALSSVELSALRRDEPVKAFACTLLMAAVSSRGGIFCQVGDGCWVVRRNGRLVAVTWPTTGAYANETTFLTCAEWRRNLQVEEVTDSIEAVAGFTDGLQSLALNSSQRSVHSTFLEPLLEVVHTAPTISGLASALETYLSSPNINARTDDDKTLVMAVRSNAPLLSWPSSIVAASQ
jgi:hypothetical protein